MFGYFAYEIVLHKQVFQTVNACYSVAVELHCVAVLRVLIHSVDIVERVSLLWWRFEKVATKREIRFVVAQNAEDGGHNVCLLCDASTLLGFYFARWVVENKGCAELANVGFVLLVVALVGVVAYQYKDGILEPRLLSGTFKETADSHICVTNALVDRQLPFFELVFVFVWHDKGVMT